MSFASLQRHVLSLCDLSGVDAAVADVCESNVVSLDVLWRPENVRHLRSLASSFDVTVGRIQPNLTVNAVHGVKELQLSSASRSKTAPNGAAAAPNSPRVLEGHVLRA